MGLTVYFNLRKKMGSVTYILTIVMTVMVLINHKVHFFTHITEHIVKQLSVVSTPVNESILAPFSKQTKSSHSPREIQ